MAAAEALDISAGTRAAVVVTWSDAAVKALFPSARDGELSPAEGFFDSATDAQACVNARGALIGAFRRRFAVTASELTWLDPVTGLPAARLIDVEQAVDQVLLVGRVELDLEAETTTVELFG